MIRKIKVDEFTQDPTITICGGIVGRIVLVFKEKEDKPQIGIQFKYLENGKDEKSTTPIYILSPWDARYAGWHLLRRGLADGLKKFLRIN